MKHLKAFWDVERAFCRRVFFVKPLMILFMFGAPAYGIFTISTTFSLGSFWWLFLVANVIILFWVALPFVFYLISPQTFFPKEG